MTHYDPTRIQASDLPAGVHYLGVDGDGEQHFTTSSVGGPTVFVTDACDGFLRYDLDEHDVGDWVANVRAKRGPWQHKNYMDTDADAGQREEAV